MTSIDRKRVLIVEDEPTICSVCKIVLSGGGFDVDIACDGKAARESVEKQEYNLLLLDIRMPVMSGIEFYVWLQEKYPQVAMRVIFMTGSLMGGQTMTFLEQCGQPYLLKPFRPAELLSTVEKFLEKLQQEIWE